MGIPEAVNPEAFNAAISDEVVAGIASVVTVPDMVGAMKGGMTGKRKGNVWKQDGTSCDYG